MTQMPILRLSPADRVNTRRVSRSRERTTGAPVSGGVGLQQFLCPNHITRQMPCPSVSGPMAWRAINRDRTARQGCGW